MDIKEADMIASRMKELSDQIDERESELKLLKEEYAEKERILMDVMVQEGKSTWEIPEGSFKYAESTYWNIRDNEKLISWIKTNAPAMLKLHPTTIRGFLNDMRESIIEGREKEPDYANEIGVVPYVKPKISFRRSK